MNTEHSFKDNDDIQRIVCLSVPLEDIKRARVALQRAYSSEKAKYYPCESILKCYVDGLLALGAEPVKEYHGVKQAMTKEEFNGVLIHTRGVK